MVHNFYFVLQTTKHGKKVLGSLLDKRTLMILDCYFEKGETLRTIGTKISLTYEGVRYVKENGLETIRKVIRSYKSREVELELLRKENSLLCIRIRSLETNMKKYQQEASVKENRPDYTRDKWHKIPVISLNVHSRTLKCLKDMGFYRFTLEDLSVRIIQESKRWVNHNASFSFLKTRNFGKKSLKDLIESLEEIGMPNHIVDLLR